MIVHKGVFIKDKYLVSILSMMIFLFLRYAVYLKYNTIQYTIAEIHSLQCHNVVTMPNAEWGKTIQGYDGHGAANLFYWPLVETQLFINNNLNGAAS